MNRCTTPLLTFCIPVYNREAYIEETLSSILSQDSPFPFEIVVSDNCSTDSTVEVVKAMMSRHSNIRLVQSDSNLGADLNYLNSVASARGEYCWLFGSDDLLLPHALDKVCKIFSTHNPNICLVSQYIGDLSAKPYSLRHLLNSNVPSRLFDFASPDDFSLYLHSATSQSSVFGFLSVIIFRRADWQAVANDSRYIGTLYVHAQKLFAIATSFGPLVYYLKDPLVIWRGGNDSFGGPGKFFSRYCIDLNGFRMLHDDFIPPALSSAFKSLFRRHHPFLNICFLRLHSTYNQFVSICPLLLWYGYQPHRVSLIKSRFVGHFLLRLLFFFYRCFAKARRLLGTFFF
jgi:abequosyltransferase